jgi:hypothetical protein
LGESRWKSIDSRELYRYIVAGLIEKGLVLIEISAAVIGRIEK